MSDKSVWDYEAEAKDAEKQVVEAGMLVKLIKRINTGVDRQGTPIVSEFTYEFPAILKSYKDKDWADSKDENFYSIHASDRYLVAGAYTLSWINQVRIEAGDYVHLPVIGRQEEFVVVRVQALDFDGYPILFSQVQLRGSRSTNSGGGDV